MTRDQSAQDEFDNLPEGSPRGVHRRVPRPWTRFVTFCVVVASFVGLGWGAAWLYVRADDIPWLHWLRDLPFTENHTPVVTPSPTPSPTPSLSPSPSPAPSYDLNIGAVVVVYNGSGSTGLANEARTYIVGHSDFTNVSTDNWDGASFSANTVRFRTEDMQDSARYLADLLGISLTILGPTEGPDIEIILVSEPDYGPEPSPTPSP